MVITRRKIRLWGLPCKSSGQDSSLPLKGAQVQCLARELGSSMPSSTAGGKKETYNHEVVAEIAWRAKSLKNFRT